MTYPCFKIVREVNMEVIYPITFTNVFPGTDCFSVTSVWGQLSMAASLFSSPPPGPVAQSHASLTGR